ncbi:DUF5134 domain-containing protein [Amycolatopsis sp. NPDC098790]|uniref:DUF5134 domain-containing protein n=1 Tax=Amycolatopsis sp. NPDC098790 TaxID=3363939 RepID=UPI00382F65EF
MGWALTAAFAALVLPCVLRLVRLDYAHLGAAVRHGDLAELLLVVAMVAMLSPVGGPIPAAGWQAVLALTAGWFATAWWRGRRSGCAHHALSAAAMCYMVTAMPHGGMDHGPWLTMSTMDSGLALPLVAVVAAGYFVADAAWSGARVLRTAVGTVPGAMAGARGAGAAAGAAAAGAGAGGAGVAGRSAVAGGGAGGAGVAAGSAVAGAGAGGAGVVTGAAVVAPAPAPAGHASRAVCRAVMGAGMGYMLLAAAL